MPSDSKTTDPRPAATDAASVIARAIRDHTYPPNNTYRPYISLTKSIITALESAGLTIAAVPPSGRVCVSEQTARQARVALRAVRVGSAHRPLHVRARIDDAYDELDAALKGAPPMTQPQPTAALSDADLAVHVITDAGEDWKHMLAIDPYMFGERIVQALEENGLAISRLARAESAPGVTDHVLMPRYEVQFIRHAATRGRNSVRDADLDRIARVCDAVLADTGTDSGTGAG